MREPGTERERVGGYDCDQAGHRGDELMAVVVWQKEIEARALR